jgi:hypothetical protein
MQENGAPLQETRPVSYDELVSQDAVGRNMHLAIDFLSRFTLYPGKMCDTHDGSLCPNQKPKAETQMPLQKALV